MTPEEQFAEDVRWLEGEATAEEALADRMASSYPMSRATKDAVASYRTSAARYRRILVALFCAARATEPCVGARGVRLRRCIPVP